LSVLPSVKQRCRYDVIRHGNGQNNFSCFLILKSLSVATALLNSALCNQQRSWYRVESHSALQEMYFENKSSNLKRSVRFLGMLPQRV
jgi:hypothetical protein